MLAIIVAVALVPAVAFALAPDPPTSLVAVPGTEDPAIAVLDWNAPSGGPVTGYRIYTSTIANGAFRYSGETSATAFTFRGGFGGVEYTSA